MKEKQNTQSDRLFFTDIESDCKEIITREVKDFMSNKVFNIEDCNFFLNKLTNTITDKLIKLSPHVKYIVNVIFLQNDEKGFTQNILGTYDKETDGVISLFFHFKEIICLINLICTSL